MRRIISIHSFRGGTGKSNTTANIAALLAAQGYRVGVIDTDIQSPGIHVIFGLDDEVIGLTLNDYLHNECPIEAAAYDVTPLLGAPVDGRVFLVPSSIKSGAITRVLREGYDPGELSEGFQRLREVLDLDVLLIDTHPGLNEETLLSIAVSDILLVVLRPDQQDYQGTGVTVEVARKLEVPQLHILVNKVPLSYDATIVQRRVEETFGVQVVAVLPHSDDLMALASMGIFVLRFPDHPISALYRQTVVRLMA
ncbi:MinD/ParA family ATP-binding protein [Candidatus Viridilinea mediisalina]|uniref:CDP-3, 6-dideoxy-D-glycero-L-glycero-4-hexulose-4-reductase n=1 Tax=Candidatus Viridilinea mediisalina TaxID=2024553 RepID=A0A2A6RJX9_9CHLR|nr:MinD/ParA family protein [Candidatus Viridilinea mediisalina]PDW03196.1 CDP-3,6-dideoxy-D-glycero-L-glycero-4-hexulose-4-reductase [Candidatus Viridilinea mediisalina]